ncbi:YncE family protein [Paenibacillus elgii]|uniref:YncE family protein n=1 Tax=Paenibacillus elgii TaxID=189691 RepID=UPI001678576D|nr:hypothetical protein [Paenibacillus elgii]
MANNRSDSVSVIDSGTNRVIATIKGVTDAATVAVNPFTNRIYVATAIGDTSRERVFVINGANNKIIANVRVGLSTLSGVVNEKNNRVYMANQGENTISVIAG